jgi:hypothetical protein
MEEDFKFFMNLETGLEFLNYVFIFIVYKFPFTVLMCHLSILSGLVNPRLFSDTLCNIRLPSQCEIFNLLGCYEA